MKPEAVVLEAIGKAGFKPGEDVHIALDAASSEFFKDGKYHLYIYRRNHELIRNGFILGELV